MSKKYEQPYRSQHVLHNTKDSLRSEEPSYVKEFPQSLHLLYKKQTPYIPRRLSLSQPRSPLSKPLRTSTGQDITRTLKSPVQTTQTSSSRKSEEKTASPVSPNRAINIPATRESTSTQPLSFKTMGTITASKSPAQVSASIPSDFEHIFHYSET